MKDDWIVRFGIPFAAGVVGMLLFPFVHVGLQHLYTFYARRYCRKRGLTPVRWRSGMAFNAAGMKTEYSVVELDCRDAAGNSQRVRLLVWAFGVRKQLETEEPAPPPPVPAGMLPTRIPYNPGLGYIGFNLGFAIFLVAFGLLLRWPVFVVATVSLLFTSLAAAMYVRRTVWPRQIVLSETTITVPSGFLRLWPTTIDYAAIEFVSVAALPGGILCVQTANRSLEILGTFIPDQQTFGLLQQHLSSFVRPSSWPDAASPVS